MIYRLQVHTRSPGQPQLIDHGDDVGALVTDYPPFDAVNLHFQSNERGGEALRQMDLGY